MGKPVLQASLGMPDLHTFLTLCTAGDEGCPGWGGEGGYFHLPTVTSPNTNRRVRTCRAGKSCGHFATLQRAAEGKFGV